MSRFIAAGLLFVALVTSAGEPNRVVAPGAKLVELGHDFQFTEGPAADAEGNVFFSDVAASRTHKWSADGQISTFRENTGHTNGLAFDKDGDLLACEGEDGRLESVDPHGKVTVLADQYNSVFADRQAGMAGIKACRLCRPIGKNIVLGCHAGRGVHQDDQLGLATRCAGNQAEGIKGDKEKPGDDEHPKDHGWPLPFHANGPAFTKGPEHKQCNQRRPDRREASHPPGRHVEPVHCTALTLKRGVTAL